MFVVPICTIRDERVKANLSLANVLIFIYLASSSVPFNLYLLSKQTRRPPPPLSTPSSPDLIPPPTPRRTYAKWTHNDHICSQWVANEVPTALISPQRSGRITIGERFPRRIYRAVHARSGRARSLRNPPRFHVKPTIDTPWGFNYSDARLNYTKILSVNPFCPLWSLSQLCLFKDKNLMLILTFTFVRKSFTEWISAIANKWNYSSKWSNAEYQVKINV